MESIITIIKLFTNDMDNKILRLEERSFYRKVIGVIKNIPKGKVATYGLVATIAGNPRAARQVAYILHSSSIKYNLPWHRVVNNKGKISLKPLQGGELQKKLLKKEGIVFDKNNHIDLKKFCVVNPEIRKISVDCG
jgi:methylated-DNA-protein-cysteine methyltransferase-like protein